MRRPSHTTTYSEILRRDFYAFCHRAFLEIEPQTTFQPNWHLQVLAAKLEEVRAGKCRRLIINMPPRHFKSDMASVMFPAWLLGHNPSMSILCASYAQELSEKLARVSRTLMNSPFYSALFSTRISDERYAIHDFETSAGGGRYSASVNGPVTGRGADIIIVDDPMKAEEALSDARRLSVHDWFDGALRSRLNNQETGSIIVVMQRIHQDDTTGHITENEKWDILSIPALSVEAENFDVPTPYGRYVYHRKEDELLQPSRTSRETLQQIRASMGEFFYQAQHQQFPISREGNEIKKAWLRFYTPSERPTKFDRIVQSWDTASVAKERNSYSVCTTWGAKGEDRYLLDVFRRRLDYHELKEAVRAEYAKHKAQSVIIEEKGSGIQLVQEFKVGKRIPIDLIEHPQADKLIRLYLQADLFRMGRVYIPQEADWLKDYILELTGFPNSKYDDQVDSTTQALAYMRKPSKGEIWARFGQQNLDDLFR